jgi:hypothetical protein
MEAAHPLNRRWHELQRSLANDGSAQRSGVEASYRCPPGLRGIAAPLPSWMNRPRRKAVSEPSHR